MRRVLRETIYAPEDLPPFDRSTRDGYAILAGDQAETFQVVDTLQAADWKPRQLKSGEAVRVATGSALPCAGKRRPTSAFAAKMRGQARRWFLPA